MMEYIIFARGLNTLSFISAGVYGFPGLPAEKKIKYVAASHLSSVAVLMEENFSCQ